MFSKIAMLVLQEQVKTKKYADVWRGKVRAKTATTEGEKRLKRRTSKPHIGVEGVTNSSGGQKKLLRSKSKSKLNIQDTPRPQAETGRTLQTGENASSGSQTDRNLIEKTENRDIKHKETRKTKKERSKCSNEIFDEVMGAIQKLANEKSRKQPTSNPSAIILDLPGGQASHEDVYYQIKNLVNSDCMVVSLQYLPQESRWLIQLDSEETCDRLSGQSIKINGSKVTLKRYDDVIAMDYKKISKANGFINNVKQL